MPQALGGNLITLLYIKLTSNILWLYPWINTSLNPCQINTKTIQRAKMLGIRGQGMLRSKWDIYIATPSPEAQGSSLKRWKKGYKRQTGWINAKQQYPQDTAGQLQGQSHSNVATWTRPAQTQDRLSSNMKRGWGNKALPLTGELLAVDSCLENPFPLSVGPGKSTTLPWKNTSKDTQTSKLDLVGEKTKKRTKWWVGGEQKGGSERGGWIVSKPIVGNSERIKKEITLKFALYWRLCLQMQKYGLKISNKHLWTIEWNKNQKVSCSS